MGNNTGPAHADHLTISSPYSNPPQPLLLNLWLSIRRLCMQDSICSFTPEGSSFWKSHLTNCKTLAADLAGGSGVSPDFLTWLLAPEDAGMLPWSEQQLGCRGLLHSFPLLFSSLVQAFCLSTLARTLRMKTRTYLFSINLSPSCLQLKITRALTGRR